jgi:hypothetical protein
MRMPWLPATPGARGLTLAGFACLTLSLSVQAPMWSVEFGRRPASPGWREHLVALQAGAPALLLASLLLGIAVSREAWRSRLAVILVLACLLDLSTWALLFAKAGDAIILTNPPPVRP